MDDAAIMRRRQPPSYLRAIIHSFSHRNFALQQPLSQSLSLQEFGNKIWGSRLRGSEPVNNENIGMVQRGGSSRLLFEAVQFF